MGNGNDTTKKRFLEGLKIYRERGVKILIEEIEEDESEWDKIFEVSEDGSFYMGDYIEGEDGRLKEIRFDKINLK